MIVWGWGGSQNLAYVTPGKSLAAGLKAQLPELPPRLVVTPHDFGFGLPAQGCLGMHLTLHAAPATWFCVVHLSVFCCSEDGCADVFSAAGACDVSNSKAATCTDRE
jgi:hypothetical protein